MPLFKRRDPKQAPGERPPVAPTTTVLSQTEIFDHLEEEVVRAQRYGRALAVLCVLPQRIPSEAAQANEMAVATEAVVAQLRFNDRVGTLEDATLVLVLPETSGDVARVIAHRIVADLAVRGAAMAHVKWLVGISTYPDDGADPPGLVVAALDRARN